MAGQPPEPESAGSSANDDLIAGSRNGRHAIDDRRLANSHGETVPGRESLFLVPPDDNVAFGARRRPKMGKSEAGPGIRLDCFVPRKAVEVHPRIVTDGYDTKEAEKPESNARPHERRAFRRVRASC